MVEHSKLSPPLLAKLEAFRKSKGAPTAPASRASALPKRDGANAQKEVIEVEIWVNGATAANLAKLKSLGFKSETTLVPGRLLLGTVSLDKLDSLLKLGFVQLVELPKFL
jgi:hypothetical protein